MDDSISVSLDGDSGRAPPQTTLCEEIVTTDTEHVPCQFTASAQRATTDQQPPIHINAPLLPLSCQQVPPPVHKQSYTSVNTASGFHSYVTVNNRDCSSSSVSFEEDNSSQFHSFLHITCNDPIYIYLISF